VLILPALLLLVLLVTVVAGLAFGAGPMGGGRRQRAVPLTGMTVVVLGGFGVLVAAVVALGLVGRSSSDEQDPAAPERVAPAVSTTTTAAAPDPLPSPPEAIPIRGLGPTVRLGGDAPSVAVGGLESTTVLQVEVEGFDPYSVAEARQCIDDGDRRCGNALKVQFDENGHASFQYLVSDEFAGSDAAGRCGADDPPCSIVVTATEGTGDELLWTFFRDPVPPRGRIEVTPSSGIDEGQAVTVTVEGFEPRTQLQAQLCALADGDGPQRCRPEPAASVMTDSRGRARTTVVVGPGTGDDGIACDRSNRCGIAVASTAGFLRSNTVPLSFIKPPGAGYDTTRLAVGLSVALLLVLVVVWLIRTTDWSPVGEQAAPELDDAEYADLDAIIALLPPEEEDALA